MMNVLMIDHYDSFTHNIARYGRILGANIEVVRHDDLTLADIVARNPDKIMLSPGPCSPTEAKLAMQLLTEMPMQWPILGICLGHQCIGAAFGGAVGRALHPMHGRASWVNHDGKGVFSGLNNPVMVGRYHSLIVTETPAMAAHLSITARCPAGEIMGLRHKIWPIESIQFHPESILTESGMAMMAQFLV